MIDNDTVWRVVTLIAGFCGGGGAGLGGAKYLEIRKAKNEFDPSSPHACTNMEALRKEMREGFESLHAKTNTVANGLSELSGYIRGLNEKH